MIKNKHNDTTFHPTTVSHFPSMNPQAICTMWKLMKSQTSLTHHYNTQSHTIIWELECQGDKVLKINYSPFLRPLFLVVSTTRVAYFICRPIQLYNNKKSEVFGGKMKVNGPRRQKLKLEHGRKTLGCGQSMQGYILTWLYEEKLSQLWVLNRGHLNFCICSTCQLQVLLTECLWEKSNNNNHNGAVWFTEKWSTV